MLAGPPMSSHDRSSCSSFYKGGRTIGALTQNIQMLSTSLLLILLPVLIASCNGQSARPTCTISPLGVGHDDTDQVLVAIAQCGHGGNTVLQDGVYNITRKMTWDLVDAKVDLHGSLSFAPNIQFWLNANNTYRVVFIQSQASWFVITGSDFEVDAHNTGGIQGNGQPWWNFFTTTPRADGDGRPISLTLFQAVRGVIRNFAIQAPPFWCNCIAESQSVVYDGMLCNASNTDPAFAGRDIVPNTDGIDTYRSDNISMFNWDITSGDDCLAIKGNSTNIVAQNVTCRGGNGIAFGSLGQYANLTDIIENVFMENLTITRISSTVQPIMQNGVYFKSWDATINGAPPTGGGGGMGFTTNVTLRNVVLDRVNSPTTITQTNGAKSGDLPSKYKFENVHYENWSGTSLTNELIALQCSSAAHCTNITFAGFNVTVPAGTTPEIVCQNADGVSGETCS
ncbi:pectin lyase fold/virulence factor [Mycena albidolilacea]|uniref:galacturonan 1,4-alpha-galacturonidase n=1 Tax=Mycena albidolilacea TaxID=1033008 RepID=A0AAD6ZGF9_9AGAR|nr:pectin lyase fold/virulence factor [Mycena albidolilacea]